MTSNAERRPRSNCAAGTAMPPNFVLLDAVLPDAASASGEPRFRATT